MDAKAAAMNKLGGPWRQAALEVARTSTKKFGKEVHQVGVPVYLLGTPIAVS